jgi:ABC-type antimicrobial peptide transport system permease subunit
VHTLSFLTYSLIAVSRNRRRSLYAIVGIALSTALIAGSLIAVDMSATGLLRSAIATTTVDFIGQDYNLTTSGYNQTFYNESVAAIQNVSYVREASYWITSDEWTLVNQEGRDYLSYAGGTYLAFVSSKSRMLLEGNRIHGEVPAPGTVAISRSAADDLGVIIGESIVCSLRGNSVLVDPVTGNRTYGLVFLNLTFPVSQIWTQDKVSGEYVADRPDLQDERVVYLNGKGGVEPVIFNLESYQTVMNSTVQDFIIEYGHTMRFSPSIVETVEFRYLIWTDRSSVINIGDLGGSVDKLNLIQSRLDKVGVKYGFFVGDSPLEYQLGGLGHDIDSMKMLFVEMSLPVAALGVYLSVVGVDMGANSRRREAGILKARGASEKLVFAYLVLEAGILGALASLIGLASGVVVCRLLFSSIPSVSNAVNTAGSFSSGFMIDPTTVELAIAFGIGLMFLSSYKSFWKVSGTTVREALHHYSPTVAQDDYSPAVDVVLIIFSVLSIVSALLTAKAVQGHGLSWITELVLGLFLAWGVVLFPFMPFFLSFGVVRILTRGWRRLYAKFSWFVRLWTKELHYLVEKNLLRNPRRDRNYAVNISNALASGLFVSVTMESTVANQHNQVLFDYGSDIKVEGQWYGSDLSPGRQLNISELASLKSIQGVRASLPYQILPVQPFPYTPGTLIRAAVIDCPEYSNMVKLSDSFFVGGGGRSKLADLEANGTALVSTQILDAYYLEAGDKLMFDLYFTHWDNGVLKRVDNKFPLTIVGAFKGLPGLSSADMVVDEGSMNWLMGRDISGTPFMANSFIALSKGADPQEVGALAKSIFVRAGLEPRIYITAEGIAALEQERGFGAMQGFLYMEYVLSVAIMSVGVGLLVFVSVEDRERELACTMARGLSGSQMRRMLMGESFTLMILGLVVGVSVGLMASYLFNTVPSTDSLVPKTMEFTAISFALLLVSIASLVFSSLLATARAGKVRLAEVLRIRGG